MTSLGHAIVLDDVVVNCSGGSACKSVVDKFVSLKGKNISTKELYRKIDFELNNSVYQSFYFNQTGQNLNIHVVLKEKIADIVYKGEDKFLLRRVMEEIPLKKGSYFSQKEFEKVLAKIRNQYFDNNDALLNYRTTSGPEGLDIHIIFSSKGLKKISSFSVEGLKGSLSANVDSILEELINNTWETNAIRRKIEEVETFLDELGYWEAKVSHTVSDSKDRVALKFSISLGKRYAFQFQNTTYFDHYKLTREMKKLVKNQNVRLTEDLIIQKISDLYKDKGVFYTDVSVRKARGVDSLSPYEVNFINVKEGQRVVLSEVVFSGNREIPTEDLESVYRKYSSTLLSRGYLDIKALETVTTKVREHYISKGFVFSSIEDPIIIFGENGRESFVTFKITESSKYLVSRINIKGIREKSLREKVYQALKSKVGQEFNVTIVDEDLKTALEVVRNEGYYFAAYAEKNPKKIIQVSNASKSININLSFNLGRKSFLGDLIVTGNLETKDIVVKREIRLDKGKLITPKLMNEYVGRLRTLGLFARVDITPFLGNKINENSSYLNFIIKVKEKNFNKAEIAPGFRTDLGYKISSSVSFNNIAGMNRSLVAKIQTNLRNSYSYLDDRRRRDENDRLEWLAQVKYIEPYLFGTSVEWDFGVKYQRKRYSGFDADILSISPSLSKQLTDKITASLEYEYDVIRQYDATQEEDDDRFKIGSITPSMTFDFRDDPTAPTKGAWFNLSWEFANPYFASQDDDDLSINYNRAIARNYFYFPVGKIVLASSLTLGMEKNFARDGLFDSDGNAVLDSDGEQKTRGFIPSLKVFRLSGRDLLRGFSDDESNVLIDGTDVSDIIVRNTAYLVNFKLEPRYYLSDNSVIALFFDAGRVFNDSVRFFDLKTSAGLSFKVLTPVGSLDFDYGVKLHRERFDNGSRESFGRFHLSIGQF